MKFIGLFLIALVPTWASEISSFSTSDGSPFSVTYLTVDATEGNMAGRLSITAEFGVNGSFDCSWIDASPNCSNANFSVSFTPDNDTYPLGGGNWSITNLHSTFVLTAITFNGVVGPGAGVAFDRCMSDPGTFNDTNSGFDCDGEGTNTSEIGWTAGSDGFGTAGIEAAASYTNILSLVGEAPFGDAYGVMRLVFAGTNSFTENETFSFEADTDLVDNASAVPEPGSIALMGSGLIGLGLYARRRRR